MVKGCLKCGNLQIWLEGGWIAWLLGWTAPIRNCQKLDVFGQRTDCPEFKHLYIWFVEATTCSSSPLQSNHRKSSSRCNINTRHNVNFEILDQVNEQLRPKKNKKYHKVHAAPLWTWNFLVIPELRNLSQKCAITGGLWCTWENCILITLPSTMVLIYFCPPTMIFTFLHSTTNNYTWQFFMYLSWVTISNLSRKFLTCLDGFKAVWIGWQLSG